MYLGKIKWLFLLSVVTLIFQSCTEDIDDDLIAQNGVEEEANIRNDGNNGNGGNNGNNGNNGNQNNGDVRNLNSNVVRQWTDLFLELDRFADGMRPNSTARTLAYIHLAAYEVAVPGMQGYRSNSGRIPDFNFETNVDSRDVDWRLALNACYRKTFDHFLLNLPAEQEQRIPAFETAMENRLTRNLPAERVEESKNYGYHVADIIIAYSQSDSEAESQILEPQPLSYEPPTGDGYWTYSAEQERALFPYWESVRSFVISPEQTSTVPPIGYSEDANSQYFNQMNEVYQLNNAARENDDESLWIAEFWSDDVVGMMFSPPARQFSIGNQLIDQFDMNLEEALHLNLKLGFSLNDAAVSAWKYKYQYMVMRPNVYLHEFIDPTYQTNLYRLVPWPNPTFPGYPSGHSTFASAAGGVFANFFGNRVNFTDRSHEGRTEFRGTPRQFRSFSEMAEENSFSRVPLGVHMSMDCDEGLRLGYEISDAINHYRIRSRPNS